VARTVYHGPYEGLPGAWPELDAWISAQGRKPAGFLWEVYLAGPESSADPAQWRTELNRPLAG
jgi:effector-binding domain-containing protein